MSLLSRIKRLLGFDGSAELESNEPPAVTVEREPQTATETAERSQSPATRESASSSDAEESGSTTGEDATPASSDAADEASSTTTGESVTVLSGIGPKYGERLDDAGIGTVEELAAADAEELAAQTDISASRIERWIETAEDHLAA